MDWVTVRSFGRIKYFHLSYAVIIGMPLLAQVYEVLLRTLLKLPYDIYGTFPLTFKLLYVSSLFYAIGIALYEYYCPTIIKNYENELTYADMAHHFYERLYADRKYEIVLDQLKAEHAELKNNLILLRQKLDNLLGDPTAGAVERKDVQNNFNSVLDMVYPSCLYAFLIKEFAIARHRYPVAIHASAFFFGAGTIVLLFLVIRKTFLIFFSYT
jgi:hypothetical protein